jgi:CBS domain-containing protein
MDMLATAQDLMTPCAELLAVKAGKERGPSLARASERRYDVVPYRENGRIAGIIRVASGSREPLTPRWLISPDTSIPDPLEILAASGAAVRLVLSGDEVVGLISAADLNKMPMRVYLYDVVASLEMALVRYLRKTCGQDSDSLLAQIREKRRTKITKRLGKMVDGGADVDPVHLFDLSDLITCVERGNTCRELLGYPTASQAKKDLGGLCKLRNATMHLTRPVISSVPEDLRSLKGRVERAKRVTQKIEAARMTKRGKPEAATA